jgi:hypothetical protein
MIVGKKVSFAAVAAALAALIVPASAQNGSSDIQGRHDHGMSMGHRMMGGGVMPGRTMAGCSGMMQSMNNGGDGRPNSQWHSRGQSDQAMPN